MLKLFLIATIAIVPALVSAHPPAADPHNSCVVRYGDQKATSPLVLVTGTLSYVARLGTSLPCPSSTQYGMGPIIAEWGSHADRCPPPPFEGAVAGAYCGPVIPPWPARAVCAWFPVVNTVPTQLIIGFDGFLQGGAPGMDGRVDFLGSKEHPVFGPFPASPSPLNPVGWNVPNPYSVQARVIAFPTAVGPFPPGALAPNDLNLVQCD